MAEVYVARQPIFNTALEVQGYELLFRGGCDAEALVANSEGATATVVLNSFTEIGVEQVVGGHTAWINVSREFVLSGLARTVPPGLVGLEILEGQVIDDRFIAALHALKAQGYRLALDDFEYSPGGRSPAPAGRRGQSSTSGRSVAMASPATSSWSSRTAIGQALALLGVERLRHWATLSLLASIDDKPPELTVTALVRARFCERAGSLRRGAPSPGQLFTLGLFSVIDALMDAPIAEVIASIPFPQEMREALIAHRGEQGRLLEFVGALEAADFDRARSIVPNARELYLESLMWANDAAEALFGRAEALAA
jgi:c-di-GMP-related signal transduction protein